MVYRELKELNVEVADGIKHYNLLGNLESVDSTEVKFLTHHSRENFSTFDQCLTHLKMYGSLPLKNLTDKPISYIWRMTLYKTSLIYV